MSLSQADREVIEEIVRKVMDEDRCQFTITEETRENLENFGHLVTALKSNEESGLDLISDNHRWARDTRKAQSKIVWTVFKIILGAITAGGLAILWGGFKEAAKQ